MFLCFSQLSCAFKYSLTLLKQVSAQLEMEQLSLAEGLPGSRMPLRVLVCLSHTLRKLAHSRLALQLVSYMCCSH